MRTFRLCWVFTLLALVGMPAFAGSLDTSAEPAVAIEAGEATAVEGADPLPAGGSCQQEMEVSAGPCPYGAPTCDVDEDCDAWCGAPGFGSCEIQHWHGCCNCYG